MNRLLVFLNSGFGLLIAGAFVGALGLFTWQRQDWVFKQEHAREQVLLDRRLDLVEAINRDAGAFLADASGLVASVAKEMSAAQRGEIVAAYNEEQGRWFASVPARTALLSFYFSPALADRFATDVAGGTEALDVALWRLSTGRIEWGEAGAAVDRVRTSLSAWNAAALADLERR